jgi:hypothetical protein
MQLEHPVNRVKQPYRFPTVFILLLFSAAFCLAGDHSHEAFAKISPALVDRIWSLKVLPSRTPIAISSVKTKD